MNEVTLTDQAATQLVRWIEETGLQPGDELPAVAELASGLSVSVPVVREAIRTLSAREILVTGQGRRARVASPSARVLGQLIEYRLRRQSLDLRDLMAVRELVETEAARLAAEHVGGADALSTALEAMERASDRETFIAADLAFHGAIAAAAGNGVLTFLLESLAGVLADARRRTYDARQRTIGHHDETLAAHRRLLTAIASGDSDAAVLVMRDHFRDIAADVAATDPQ